jgi:hypothetical protein
MDDTNFFLQTTYDPGCCGCCAAAPLVHSSQLRPPTPFTAILAEHNTGGLLVFATSLLTPSSRK